ncbi:MAG: hypothetical protein DCF19_20615 [Pseudanabaena frigida]|uniref:Uncharacterized protein n=1 Tax=Pseudanabaena frigida TaxID=945775 RepID=A0A2W4VVB6_9CYAN|nr:MAG: hypothetical protein DCF19_20615 [Pseudanabaena frigida]
MKGKDSGNYPDRDSQQLNVRLSSGFFGGDRIEQVHIPNDRDHNSFHVERLLRRQLEIPPMPEFIAVTVVRMAISTFAVSIALEVAKNATDLTGILVLGIFTLAILVFLWVYCVRAIARQPQLTYGVVYLWLCVALGAVFGIIGGSHV